MNTFFQTRFLVAALALLAFASSFALSPRSAFAKNPETPETAPSPDAPTTFLDHGGISPFWFGAEANSIAQFKPAFAAPYTGMHSLLPSSEAAVSGLFTLFFAYSPHRTTELIADLEMAVGTGLSQALGIAGFTNLDVVRNPSLGSDPYVARLQIHQIIPLSRDWIANDDRGPVSSLAFVPRHRLELRVGKMSLADLFDINPAGSDSHLQFMNWTVDNNGAWDYAADTRGYTYAADVEYQGPRIEVRFAEALMPTVANGITLDWNLLANHSENLELEVKYSTRKNWAGTVRVLGFMNHANMGVYQDAINGFKSGADPTPNITKYDHPGTLKYGFGLNVIQELGPVTRIFARGGWNDGKTESFAYTEVDDTFEIGADLKGTPWHRENDKTGLAFVTNGLSEDHREYLKLGGLGFILGDGNLNYGREYIVEHYYNLHIWRGAFVAGDIQAIVNPGYNQDRGPAWVFSLRGHLEF